MNEAKPRRIGGVALAPLIELVDLQKTFVTDGGVRVDALRGVSLSIAAGEFVAIMGQSGSGKTTLMNIIGCLDKPTGGQYLFNGEDVSGFDADELAWLRREAFGFVFQSYNLLNNATALENVEVPAVYAGHSQSERRARAAELLEQLGLGDRLAHRPNQLSGGQQQRVSIARALMNGGRIILADEPTGALDTKSGADVMALLGELAEAGHTVILITHDPNVAKRARRVIEISDGAIVSDTGAETQAPSASPVDLAAAHANAHASSFAGFSESLRMALRALRANIFRTVLTLLGIVIGVGSVVAMLAIGEGAKQQVLAQIGSMGTNLVARAARHAGSARRWAATSPRWCRPTPRRSRRCPTSITRCPKSRARLLRASATRTTRPRPTPLRLTCRTRDHGRWRAARSSAPKTNELCAGRGAGPDGGGQPVSRRAGPDRRIRPDQERAVPGDRRHGEEGRHLVGPRCGRRDLRAAFHRLAAPVRSDLSAFDHGRGGRHVGDRRHPGRGHQASRCAPRHRRISASATWPRSWRRHRRHRTR